MSKKKGAKGNYGYVKAERKKRLLITLLLFAIPLLIFFSGVIYNGTRNNILTVVAILGCLPACKSTVGAIMIWLVKPMKESDYRAIAAQAGNLTMAYELLFTTYEKNTFVDALAICGNQLVGYSSRLEKGSQDIEKHLTNMMRNDGFALQVKIIPKLEVYLERLAFLEKNQEAIRAGVRHTPRNEEAGISREEQIREQLLTIAL